MVIGLLGILKAGGAYLPLDPAIRASGWPSCSRRRRAGAVTHSALVGRLPAHRADIVRLDADAAAIAAQPASAPAVTLDPHHPAYVIYTSGSTGTPKGVAMAHGPLGNLIAWSTNAIRSERGTAVAQFAAISFDVSAQEILSALTVSKTLFARPTDIRGNPAELLRWLADHKINELFAPNLVIDALCEVIREKGHNPTILDHVAQAGEALALKKTFSLLRP